MKINDIVNTFPEHRAALHEIFRTNEKIPDSRFQPTYDECNFLLILAELLSQSQQHEMYKKIRSEFDNPYIPDDITSIVCYFLYLLQY